MASPHPMLGAIPGFWAVAFCRAGFAGCSSRCPCSYQAQMLGIPAGMDQKDIYAVQVVAVLASGSRSSTFTFVPQRQTPMVQSIQQTTEIPPVAVRWSMFPLCGRADSQVLPWRRHSCSHSCSSLRNQILSTTLRIWQSLVRCVA